MFLNTIVHPITVGIMLILLPLNFVIDGAIFLWSFSLFYRNRRDLESGQEEKFIYRKHMKQILSYISLHVLAGYIADFVGYIFFEHIIINELYAEPSDEKIWIVWGIYALLLGITHGLTFCFTLRNHRTKFGINQIFGMLLFMILTNPINFSYGIIKIEKIIWNLFN